jgi:TnpA family transposase
VSKFWGSYQLAQIWGDGKMASADGVRLQFPVQTVHAGYNRKYNATGPISALYTSVSDQYTGFHAKIMSTFRDSFYVLDGLLEQTTSLEPHQLCTDTAGYSDVIFAPFSLLGFKSSST